MSMINDALKRARVTQPRSLTADGPAFRTVETMPRAKGGIDYLMVSLIVVILLLAALLLFAWYTTPVEVRVRARSTDVSANAVAVAPQPVPAVAAVKTPLPVMNVTNAPVAVASVPAVVTEEASKPVPVVFRLQGIIYRAKNPSAMINGKTVFIGDQVAGARVVAIGNDSATIVTETGQKKVLDLP